MVHYTVAAGRGCRVQSYYGGHRTIGVQDSHAPGGQLQVRVLNGTLRPRPTWPTPSGRGREEKPMIEYRWPSHTNGAWVVVLRPKRTPTRADCFSVVVLVHCQPPC